VPTCELDDLEQEVLITAHRRIREGDSASPVRLPDLGQNWMDRGR
jgi:hypothetical protein